MSNSSNTYTMSTAGLLYLRGYSGGLWGAAQDVGRIPGPINPGAPVGSNGSRTGDGSVTIGATPTAESDNIRWYTTASGGTHIGTGLTFNTPSISSTTTYYAASFNTANNCESLTRTAVIATVLPPAPTGSIVVNRCRIITANRTGTPPPGHVWYWQTSSNGTSVANSGSTYTMYSSGTLYLRAYFAGEWSSSSLSSGYFDGPIDPAPPTVTNGTRCGSGTVTLSATPSAQGDNIRWYDGGGTLLFTGSTFITPSLSPGTYEYYAATYNTSQACESSSRATAIATVYVIPDVTTAGSLAICSGQTTAITISNPNSVGATFSWTAYSQSAGGYSNGSGSTIAQTLTSLVNSESDVVYTITPTANGCSGTPITRTVKITTIPTIQVTGPNPIVMGTPTQLSTTQPYASYQWQGPGNPLTTTPSITLSSAGEYSVSVTSSGGSAVCTSNPLVIGSAFAQQGANVDAISITTIFKEGVSSANSLYSLQPEEYAQVNKYTDGLGRLFQTVGQGQSPVNRGDLVSHTAYGRDGFQTTAYLPFATASPDGRLKKNAIRNISGVYAGSDQQLFYQGTPKVAADNYPFARTKLRSAPDARVIEQGAPGQDWQLGGGHTIQRKISTNSGSYSVRYWKSDGTTNSTYTQKSLLLSISTDENGNKVRIFTNRRGQTILKQVQLDETINGTMTNWLDTYYIYDDYGNLTYQIPPKALNVLGNGTTLDANIATVGELIFKYTYDTRGRLVEKKEPGAAAKFMVYDFYDRLVLTQDGALRTMGKWAYVKYDELGRAVYTGLYANNKSRSSVQKWAEKAYTASSSTYPEANYVEFKQAGADSLHGYSNVSFPKDSILRLSVAYYDNYDFNANGTPPFTYDAAHIAGLPSTASSNVTGMATGTKTRMLSATGNVTANWLKGVVFYDDYDRVIQTQANNHLDLNALDKSSVLYNTIRRVTRTKLTHTAQAVTTHVTQRNDYDHAGRVLRTYHQVNSNTEVLAAQYEYNALGQLVDKRLHDTGGSVFLQSVDYRYTIRGWLQSINNAQLSSDGGATNDDTGDFFGMELAYNTNAGMGNNLYYNGNIGATKWKTLGEAAGAAGQRSYKYTYDKVDQLKTATFQAHDGAYWAREVNTLNESMTYDQNGNILTLTRNKNSRGLTGTSITSAATAIDILTYTYLPNSNQIDKVEDAGTSEGFNNGAVNGVNEYTYTGDGSMNKDANKGITSITYNMLGKAQVVLFGSGVKLEYIYDAAGIKRAMRKWNGATLENVSNYSGGFVYEGATPVMSYFSSPEGRVVKNGAMFEYQYFITDHQGNNRVVFSSVAPAPLSITATFEGNASDNASQFTNVNAANVVTFTAANNTPGGTKVVRLNQNYKVGPTKSLRVYPGDKVDTEVWTYYENNSGFGTGSPTVAAMVTAVASGFGGVSGGGGESGNIFNGVNSALGGFGLGGNASDNAPAAYLNYILFDQNYKVLNMGWQRVPTSAYFSKQKMTLPQVSVKEAGFIFLYLSYEDLSNNFVQFDDFKVTHTKSNLIQANEYYPYGLQTASSWTRENVVDNRFLYNGSTELNKTTQVYDLFYRNYDPALGRFGQVDPMASQFSSLSPYNYGNNDPVYFNDPLGDCPECGSWEDRFDVTMGPHDTSDPNRAYRYSDPYGSRANWLYAMHLELITKGQVDAEVYNKWCNCFVSANEIISVNNPNQNREYRNQAERALREKKMQMKQDERNGKTNGAMELATTISLGLLADDASGALVLDDILIPFLFAAAYVAEQYNIEHAGEGNENYPGPLVYTVPDPTTIPPEYVEKDPENHFPGGNNILIWAGGVVVAVVTIFDQNTRSAIEGISIEAKKVVDEGKSYVNEIKSKFDDGMRKLSQWYPGIN